MSDNESLNKIGHYYTDKIERFGPSPKGAGWNSEESQHLRFVKLLKMVDPSDKRFSVLDYGCGYGSLLEFMKKRFDRFNYTGYDISQAMITEARKLHKQDGAHWTTELKKEDPYDFVFASGIFNVKLDSEDKTWEKYIVNTLDTINEYAVKGFSFNVLTRYSDKELMRDDLYYADPAFLFDYCKCNFSKHVALLHDYPLYEFTIVVKKNI